jgi:hypothetical protein
MNEINILLIKEICHFIKTKCDLMNEGNFKDLSEMIINDVNNIESKLNKNKVTKVLFNPEYCDLKLKCDDRFYLKVIRCNYDTRE